MTSRLRLQKIPRAPRKDQAFWSNDLYKDDYSEWGTAVACGHLSKFTTWKTADSNINVALYGENFDVTCQSSTPVRHSKRSSLRSRKPSFLAISDKGSPQAVQCDAGLADLLSFQLMSIRRVNRLTTCHNECAGGALVARVRDCCSFPYSA